MWARHAHFWALNSFLFCAVLFPNSVQGNCKPGWETYSWDLTCHKKLDPTTFDDALKKCEAEDGSLSTDLSVQSLLSNIENYAWVGIRDNGDGQGLKVLDGSDLPADELWGDNVVPAALPSGSKPKCAILNVEKWGLDTADCDQSYVPLCQQNDVKCPNDWYPMAGDCFKIFSQPTQPWQEANDACVAIGAEPMKILTNDQRQQFSNYIGYNHPDGFWTGAKALGGNQYEWFDGTNLDTSGFTYFKLVDLNTKAKTAKCGYIFTDYSSMDTLNFTTECETHKAFACFLKGGSSDPKPLLPQNPNLCTDGYQVVGNTCYWKSDFDMSWPDARDECDRRGGNLFIASTIELQYDLQAITDTSIFWIGMSRPQAGEDFSWIDQSMFLAPFDKVINGILPEGNCVAASKNPDFVYHAVNCDQVTSRFICQKPQDAHADPYQVTQVPLVPSGDCGNGWEQREMTDDCYSFVTSSSTSWYNAESQCVARGGHLASIYSNEEEVYLLGRIHHFSNDQFWIGATRSVYEGFFWKDETPFRYINWQSGEPVRDTVHEFVLWEKPLNEWVTASADATAAGICKKKVEDPNKPDPHLYTTPQSPGSDQFYECDENWLGYENNCYLASQLKKNWFEARDECMHQQASLVSIGSSGENSWVESILSRACKDEDTSDNCKEFKRNGRCTRDKLVMSYLCPQTCDFCDGKCRNIQSTWLCEDWKAKGDCISNPEYMMEKCQLTCGCGNYIAGHWIGLNKVHSPSTFDWSDQQTVTFTTWNVFEPNGFDGKRENCVVMDYYNGKWSDEDCYKQSMGFVCKKPKTYQKQQRPDPLSVGCQPGTLGYKDQCYWFSKDKMSWSDAKADCESRNNQLVYIKDFDDDAFLTAELNNYQIDKAWIGYINENGEAKWYNYYAQPHFSYISNGDLDIGDCAAITWNHDWYASPCTTKLHYICMAHRAGYSTMAATTLLPTTVPEPCPGGWTAFNDKCYKVFEKKKSWEQAQSDCISYGGNLVTISDSKKNDFIYQDLKANKYDSKNGMWIGLFQKQIGGGHVWVDTSALTFKKWGPKQPDDTVKTVKRKKADFPHCVAMYKKGKWYSFDCGIIKPYACETYRGGMFMTHSTPYVAPVQYCKDDGWREDNGMCYFSGGDTLLSWTAARKECISKGADLVSIQSDQENNFVQSLAKDAGHDRFWIGLNMLMSTSYKWSDGSTFFHQNWAYGEPNDAHGGEKCVSLYGHDGKWNDDHCSKSSGYICKKREGTAPPPTDFTQIDGKCPDGFKSETHSNKCFFLSDDGDKTSWDEAQSNCKAKNPGAELATIKGSIDQEFVTLLLESSGEESVWIGLNAKENKRDWVWADNMESNIDNWGRGQPKPSFLRLFDEKCVSVQRRANPKDKRFVGDWEHNLCRSSKPYLCQALRVPSPGATDPDPFADQYSTGNCPSSKYFYYHNRCYQFFGAKKKWQDAKDYCKSIGGSLALVWDEFEGSRLNYDSYKNDAHVKFWIDVKYDTSSNGYVWGNNYEVLDAKWEKNEPDQPDDDSCVTFFDGLWYDEPCDEKKPFFCVNTNYDEFIPTTPDPSAPTCKNPKHKRLNGKCYWVDPDLTVTWWDAARRCSLQDMHLTSVHSKEEVGFLTQLVQNSRTDKKNAWIGLDKGVQETWRWTDGSAYVKKFWARGEPNSPRGLTTDEDCAEMMLDHDGKWNDVNCDVKLAFICSTDAVYPTVAPTKIDEQDPPAPLDTDDNPEPAQPPGDDDDEPAQPPVDDDDEPAQPPAGDDEDDDQPSQTDDDRRRPSIDDDDRRRPSVDDNDDKRRPNQDDDSGVSGRHQEKKDTYSDNSRDGGLSGGAIAGIVIGVLLLVAIVAVAGVIVQRRYPLWRQESILRGSNSSGKVAFDNALYRQEAENGDNVKGALDFGHSAA